VPFINKFFVVYFNVSTYKYDDETMVNPYRNALALFAELPYKLAGKTILKSASKGYSARNSCIIEVQQNI
jgi:hypothetical protein